MAGRRSKLTPQLQEKLIGYLKMGNYEGTAARACGIGESTYFNWKAKGEAATSGKYREFVEAVQLAVAEAELLHVGRILKAGQKNWQASAWWLERKNHADWGRKDYRGTLDKDGKPTDPDQSTGRVLVVPAHIDDIHEWSKRAKTRVKNAANDRESAEAADGSDSPEPS